MKKHIIGVVAMVLTVICLGMTFLYSESNDASSKIQTIALDNPIFSTTIDEMKKNEQKEDGYGFTAWEIKKQQLVSNKELVRETKVDAFLINGDSKLLYPEIENLTAGDDKGCLIDEKTAYKLFGDTRVTNQKISFEGKSFIIRGVIKNKEDIIVLQQSQDAKAQVNYISIDMGNRNHTKSNLELFTNRHGITGKGINMQIYQQWAKMIAMILPLIIIATIIFPLIGLIRRDKNMPFKVISYFILIFIFALLFIYIMKIKFVIPEEMIPNKWSDFDFWSKYFTSKSEEVMFLLKSEKNQVVMSFVTPLVATIKYSILGCLIFLVFLRKKSVEKIEELFIYTAIVFLATFGYIMFCGINARGLLANKAIWFLIPLFLCGKFVLYHIKSKSI